MGRRSRGVLVGVLALLGLAAMPAVVTAHQPSDSYLNLKVTGDEIEGQWDIALVDLDQVIDLDVNGDGDVTESELAAKKDEITSYAFPEMQIRADGAPCAVTLGPQVVVEHPDGFYAGEQFKAACPPLATHLAVDYQFLADVNSLHRGLLNLTEGGTTHTAVLSPDSPRFEMERAEKPDLARQAFLYGREGVVHIWSGLDHILFLLSLLLPVVLVREDGRWRPANGGRTVFVDVLKVVTAFTVAHSITLTAAVLGWVNLPARLTESLIAATVVLAAANNVWPIVTRQAWVMAFAFGLIHGLGFAGALQALGLPKGSLALSLLSFNVGVEVGQLSIVLLFLPLAFMLRDTRFYSRLVLQAGSLAILLVASLWFVQRAFGVALAAG